MSDLEKELPKVQPPKPKRTQKQKAQKSVKEILQRSRQKVATAEQALVSAKKSANFIKQKYKTINTALNGKETQVIEQSVLDTVSPSVKQHIEKQNVVFRPNTGPQTEFLASSEREVFYGGARGGGKSYAMLVDPLRYCHKQTHRALLLRRTMPELRDLINHSQRLYAKAYPGAKWREQEKEWRFPSGAKIEFGYAENMTDALRTEIPVYMRATGNPGNIGSQWVREMFVDPAVPNSAFDINIDTPLGTKVITRRFIPAKLQDNPYLTQTDDYYAMLASLPEVQRKQFLDGDWDAFEDSAFPEFNKSIHVVDPFEVPKGWQRFRAADWGYSSPACVLWFAIDYDNNLWIYRELYTKKITADVFARKVLIAEKDEYIRYGVLDASTWAKRGDIGPSIAETMIRVGCKWRPSDRTPKSRISGKLEIHKRLKVSDDKKKEPGLRIFSTCRNLIRTFPLLPLDDNNPEDINTDVEDHAYDALRYGCMSRPIHTSYAKRFNQPVKPQFIPADRMFGY